MGNNENFRQRQPQYQQHSYYRPPQGPPVGVLFQRSSIAKIGLFILILSIIGLILSYTMPWAYNEDADEKYYGHDLENKNDEFLFFGDKDNYDYITDAPGMADIGLIFLLIMSVLAIIFGVMSGMYQKRYSIWFNFTAFIIAVISLIPCLWIITTGMKFVGYNVNYALNEYDPNYIYPAAYVMLILGLIFFIMIFKFIKNQSHGNFSQMFFSKRKVNNDE